jgi:hypothetical protein
LTGSVRFYKLEIKKPNQTKTEKPEKKNRGKPSENHAKPKKPSQTGKNRAQNRKTEPN